MSSLVYSCLAATPETSIYESIQTDQIRLLRLMKGQSAINIQLVTFQTDECPEYTALSYVWGDTKSHTRCQCNGQPFDIGTSLHDALNSISALDRKTRWYWADAICINQNDEIEKALLVADMANVYRRAERTVIWLGLADTDSDLAMERIIEMYNFISTNSNLLNERLSENDFHRFHVSVSDTFTWSAIFRLLARPWFRRLWVIQEVTLSADKYVQCGQKCISWDDLVLFIFFLNLQGHLFAAVLEKQRDMYRGPFGVQYGYSFVMNVDRLRLCKESVPPVPFLSVLISFLHDQLASERLDYVYGVHAILPDSMRSKIAIDYSVSAKSSWRKVHARLFVSFLQEMKTIPSDCLLGKIGDRDIELPSWCPDWVNKEQIRSAVVQVRDASAGRPSTSQREFAAKDKNAGLEEITNSSIYDIQEFDTTERLSPIAPSLNEIQLSDNCRILSIAGVCFDEIDRVLRLENRCEQPHLSYISDCVNRVMTFTEQDLQIRPLLPGILLSDNDWQHDSYYSGYDGSSLMVDLQQMLSEEARLTLESLGHFTGFARFAFRDTPVRMLAKTKNGRYGSVPVSVMPGDQVCIFFNAEVPVILTPPDAGDHQELRGAAYIDGVMHGELFTSAQIMPLVPQVFNLV